MYLEEMAGKKNLDRMIPAIAGPKPAITASDLIGKCFRDSSFPPSPAYFKEAMCFEPSVGLKRLFLES